MESYYKHSRKEDVKIPYYFQCESCFKDSGKLDAYIVGEEAVYNSNFKTLKEEKAQQLAEQAHKNFVEKVKDLLNE